MKKIILSTVVLAAALFSNASFAGCGQWGQVNYVYKSSTGVLAIVGGTACWISAGDINAIASVLSTANANNKQGYVTSSGDVAIEYQ